MVITLTLGMEGMCFYLEVIIMHGDFAGHDVFKFAISFLQPVKAKKNALST